MTTIFKAKKQLLDRYRLEEGFIGVGIGRYEHAEALRVYVEDVRFPIAQQFKNDAIFEGFPVIVEVTGKVRALSV